MSVTLKKVGNPGFVRDDAQRERLLKNLAQLKGVKGVKNVVGYFTDGTVNKNYRTGSEELSVFVQAIPDENILQKEVLDMEFGEGLERLIPTSLPENMVKVYNENQIVIAFASMEYKSIYIPWMIDHLDFEEAVNIISYITDYVFVNYFEELENIDSWKKSKQKNELKERVERYLKKGNEKQIKDSEQKLHEREAMLIERQNEIKSYFDAVIHARKKLEVAQNDKVLGLDNYLQGLDLIADHPKVENLIVKENNIEIRMHPLKIRATVEGEEKFYALNGAKMMIDIDSGVVKFDSDTKRRSHWTAKDPHPHVNGNSGNACLGNIANTIAELASEREIYPLYLICLDFLENANTDDPAGRKVVNWDEIVEEEQVAEVEKKKVGRHKKKYPVFTVFVDGGGYHTEVEMTTEEMDETGVMNYEGDLLMPDVYEKLMKVIGE